jgi:hypothetical protein
MLKYFAVCAALAAMGFGSATAQEQQATVQKIKVPAGGFDILLATPKSPKVRFEDLSESPDALVIHLAGGELAAVYESAEDMLKTLDALHSAGRALRAEVNDGKLHMPVVVYLIPQDE